MRSIVGQRVDRRVVRTRRAIVSAFERLVSERGLDGLTVSAIAQAADIDRKTFYTHFGSIDGLLDALADDRVVEILDELDAALKENAADCTTDGAGDADTAGSSDAADGLVSMAIHEFFAAVNRSVRRNMQVNRRLLQSIPPDDLLMRLRRPLAREIMERGYARLLFEEVPRDLFDCMLTFELAGILAVYRRVLQVESEVEGDVGARVGRDTPVPAYRNLKSVERVVNVLVAEGIAGLNLASRD